MPRDLDLTEVAANAQRAQEWSTSNPEPPHARMDFIPLSVREHFDHYVPTMVAEIERLRAHSTTLNTLSWKIATALGDVPEGADRIEGDPVEQTERLIVEITRLRAAAVGDAP